MNSSIKKIVIVAFFSLYLSWETSAATIKVPESIDGLEAEGAEAIDRAEALKGVIDEGLGEAAATGATATEATEATTTEATEASEDIAVFKAPATYKCGNLECPNGAFCEIKQKPDFTEKKVTITTQCRDCEGKVLAEETTTENIPEGKIPFTSVARKIVKGDSRGSVYGGSYTGSFSSGGFRSIDSDEENPGTSDFGFDKIWSVPVRLLDCTSKMLKNIFYI